MKILMAGYFPFYEYEIRNRTLSLEVEAGGVGTALFNLARSIVDKGIEVEIIAPGPKDFRGVVSGIQVVYKKEFQANFKNNLKIMGTQKSPLALKKSKKKNHEIFEKEEFDIFHTHGASPFTGGPILAANELRIPSVMTVHGHWPVCFNNKLYWNGDICEGCKRKQFKFIKCIFHEDLRSILMLPLFLAMKNKNMAVRQKAIEKTGKIVTVSNYLKDILIRFGFEDEKIIPIYNAFQPQKRPNQEYLPYFCCVGRIFKEKGLKNVLYALPKVVNEHPEVKLLIIGEKRPYDLLSEKKKLIELTRKLGLSKHVMFTGWKPNDVVIDFISKSTAVVFPSVGPEIFPMAILEGMGCGKPVIATNLGGIPEIVEDGNNGSLVPPHDSEKLAKEMIFLLDNPAEVQRMGKNALETVKRKCNPDIITNEHIKLYQSLIN
jgi:glycosyltransferase involved in cell wall biosynthesis